MYSNFYIDKSTFEKKNIENTSKNLIFFFNKWRDDCFVININQKDFVEIYNHLKINIKDQKILDQFFKFTRFFRGSNLITFDNKIDDYYQFEKLCEKLFIDCEVIVLKNNVVENLLGVDFSDNDISNYEKEFEDFRKDENFEIRCISNFDRYSKFKAGSKLLTQNQDKVSTFFNNHIMPLIMASKQIDILDIYCLVNMYNCRDYQVSGVEKFVKFLKKSPVKRVSIISAISQEDKEKTNVSADNIFNCFEEIVAKYSDDLDDNNKIEISVTITKKEVIKDLDRIILFDKHSVIDIHGLTSLTATKNDLFKKDVTCHRYKDIKLRSDKFMNNRRIANNNSIGFKTFNL